MNLGERPVLVFEQQGDARNIVDEDAYQRLIEEAAQ